MLGMTAIRARVIQAEAQRLDAKRTKRALKTILPGVEWLYTTVYGSYQMNLLLSAGWEVVSSTPDMLAGTKAYDKVVMRKRNL